jgi:hypothetical protein
VAEGIIIVITPLIILRSSALSSTFDANPRHVCETFFAPTPHPTHTHTHTCGEREKKILCVHVFSSFHDYTRKYKKKLCAACAARAILFSRSRQQTHPERKSFHDMPNNELIRTRATFCSSPGKRGCKKCLFPAQI